MAGEGEVIACHTITEWDEKFKAAKESNKLIVIDFTATWCPPCRFIAPIFAEYAKNFLDVVFFKVDVDQLATVAKQFEVEAMPTFIYMRGEQILDKIVGASKDEIHAKLVKHSVPAVASA
uniref:Thioredoxin H-type n=1 Tax=Noccaea caerulescens TaxID=107243 RepID=A0A1J3K828_NOCCA